MLLSSSRFPNFPETNRLSGVDDTLWTGVPGDYTNPDAPGFLSKVRKLVDDGQYAEATAAAFGLSDHPPEVGDVLSVCLFFLSLLEEGGEQLGAIC